MKTRPSKLPIIVVSGASGFIGRHVLHALCDSYYIYALARRPQKSADVPIHQNIVWIRVDIANERDVKRIFNEIAEDGGADFCIHLAGFYDFKNRPDPEYKRTNVDGTRNILSAALILNIKRFIFSSSLAAIDFFDPKKFINEKNSLDAVFPYAVSKREGEKLVESFSSKFPCSTIRFAAIFSDWCEYLPLYCFLSTWLSSRWDRRILVGKGKSAIPYLHINDLIDLFLTVFKKTDNLPRYNVLHASPRTSTSQRDLFNVAQKYNYFRSVHPLYIKKWFAALGIMFRNFYGSLFEKPPFECLWMLKYVDEQLIVDSSHTQKVLNWKPSQHFSIKRRLLFMIDKMKANPYEWHYKNKKRLVVVTAEESQYLKIYEAMLKLKEQIVQEILVKFMDKENAEKFKHYQRMGEEARMHCVEYIYKMLEIDIRTGDRSNILDYAEHLAEHRYLESFPVEEVMNAIRLTSQMIVKTFSAQPELKEMKQRINDEVAITMQMVVDEIEDTYVRLSSTETNNGP